MEQNEPFLKAQVIPIALAFVAAAVFAGVIALSIPLLNSLNTLHPIVLHLRWYDVVIGFTIYIKTSVDFAIFMGHLIRQNLGWKNRTAIEFGTAAGNAFGTLVVMVIWTFFREVRWLLALMIFVAALVLLRLAAEGLGPAEKSFTGLWGRVICRFADVLRAINRLIDPVLGFIVPKKTLTAEPKHGWWKLVAFSFTVPFILGLDDFAGYVPLFSVVNIFGFAVGAIAAHTVLTILLFVSPTRTANAVLNPAVSLVGSLVFVGLAAWGFHEALNVITGAAA